MVDTYHTPQLCVPCLGGGERDVCATPRKLFPRLFPIQLCCGWTGVYQMLMENFAVTDRMHREEVSTHGLHASVLGHWASVVEKM